ncbi:gas vesicle protein GvpC [Caulobacter sp. UNC358MFTsu5.1]
MAPDRMAVAQAQHEELGLGLERDLVAAP